MIEDKLHIIVCIKYTASSASGQESSMAVSPFDEYAIEEGVRIKERLEGKAVVTAVTLGSERSMDGLRDAIARGADGGVLLSAAEFDGSDTYATAYILSKAIAKLGQEKGPVDLVLCGKQTNDSDTGQVGPALAAHLGVPSVTSVRKIQELVPGQKAVVHRATEDGAEVLEAPLPAVLSTVKELNEPRIPSLKGKMAARKAQLPKWGPSDIGAEAASIGRAGSLVSWGETRPVPTRSGGETINGATPQETAQNLLNKLKERGLV